MHARVVTADILPGKIDEAMRLWEEHVAPAFKNVRGCQTGFLLTNPDKHSYMSVSIWVSQESASEFDSSGLYQKLVSKFEGVFAGSPVRETYEVSGNVTKPDRKESSED